MLGAEPDQDAVKKIYQGAPQVVGSKITLSVTKPNQKTLKISWPSSAFDNCRQNIAGLSTLAKAKQEIIPRVNPNTYQAFLQAAFEMDLEELEINSGWRPMPGSVLHRIGIGLDVGTIKAEGHPQSFRRSKTAAERNYSDAIAERKKLEKKKRTDAG